MRKSITKVSCRILSLRKLAEEVKCELRNRCLPLGWMLTFVCMENFFGETLEFTSWPGGNKLADASPTYVTSVSLRVARASRPLGLGARKPRFHTARGPSLLRPPTPSCSPRPLFIRVSVFQMPSFLFPSSVGVQGVSEPSKEKLKVCNEWRIF